MYKISPAVEKHFLKSTPKERVAATIAAIKSSRSVSPDPELIAMLSGWGSIKDIIWNQNKYPDLRTEFESLLSEQEMEFAKTGTLWAFHTSFDVIRYMWQMAKLTGFNGGRIIESGCGAGHFFGAMPKFDDPCELWGVEIDPTPAKACQALYPEANIANVDFRDFKCPKGYFDLAIGNVPFGDVKVYDDDVYSNGGLSIHNYFLAKNLALVRPGGLVMIVTSSFAMDNRDASFRDWLARGAELMDITPLTDTTFKSFANTEVCADILTFQKLKSPRRCDWLPADCSWTKTVQVTIEGEVVLVNEAIAKAYNLVEITAIK